MRRFVFFLGHPGTGKTTLAEQVSARLAQQGQTAIRYSDRPFFFQAMDQDIEQRYHHRYADGGHDVTDPRLFQIQFQLLRQQVLSTAENEDWAFIELTSRDYASMLSWLGADLLSVSSLVWVNAPLEVALLRNSRRPETSQNPDETHIPEHYIRACYAQLLDMSWLRANFRSALWVENGEEDWENLRQWAGQVIEFLNEFSGEI